MNRHYAISLFSGAGGLDLGVEAAGFTTKLCTDIDSFSCTTLKNNQESNHFGLLKEANIVQKNLKEYPTDDILKDAGIDKGSVDLVYGGPPCQAFSVFGKRLGLEDTRGTLVYDYIRVIREIQPKSFIFENVKGLLSMNGGDLISTIMDGLSKDEDGNRLYEVSYGLFNTAEYGVPQYRQRIIIYGIRSDIGQAIPMPKPTNYPDPDNPQAGLLPPMTVSDAFRGLPIETTPKIPNHIGRKHGQAVIDRYGKLAYGERDTKTRINKLDPKKPSFTIVVGSDKGGGKGHIHPIAPREVTPRESARIQTFPDFWEFEGTSRHPIRQVGNAVPPVFAGVIASNLLRYGFGENDAPDYNELVERLGLDYLKK